jgi:hypothetical protein
VKGVQPTDQETEEMSFEAKQNAVGFFQLLLKIDQRTNPDRYSKTL